jgi:hypothetical protein
MVLLFAGIWREHARLRVCLRRLRPSVRLALLPVLSGIVGGFPGGRATEDLNGPLVLLGSDLASSEALPEDLLTKLVSQGVFAEIQRAACSFCLRTTKTGQ